jgi:hypothetical protein
MRPTRVSLFGRGLSIAIGGLAICLALTGPALAQEEEPDAGDRVVLTGGLHLQEGETASLVVVFDGPVTIDGTVTGTLVVFNGRTEISGTVRDDVVVFNGEVLIRSSAEIGGDVATNGTPAVVPGATIGGDIQGIERKLDLKELGFAGRFVWWIGYTMSTLFLGLLLLLFFPRLDEAITGVLERRMAAALGFGAAAFLLIPILAALALVTVVGIPLGIFVLLGLALVYTVGYVVAAHALGRLMIKPPTSRYLAFLAGLGILRLVELLPFAGGLIWVLAAIFGLGFLTVAARGERRTGEPAPPEVPAAP